MKKCNITVVNIHFLILIKLKFLPYIIPQIPSSILIAITPIFDPSQYILYCSKPIYNANATWNTIIIACVIKWVIRISAVVTPILHEYLWINDNVINHFIIVQ